MDPNTAYLFDDYTNPYHRGEGLHRKIIAIREYEARKQGKSVTFAYDNPQTAPRRKASNVADM